MSERSPAMSWPAQGLPGLAVGLVAQCRPASNCGAVTQTVRPEPAPEECGQIGIDLYWIPLGAGGAGFVRFNGRVYEAIRARLERRAPLDLYHTALEVRLPEGRFTIENAWPIPDADTSSRGVVLEGPVGTRRIARLRSFRYEVRCWRDGVIQDADEAVSSPQILSEDPVRARDLLESVAMVPPLLWGRDELGIGEMWNSNSVVAWLLAFNGLPAGQIRPPAGGSAPGWEAGIAVASASTALGVSLT